MRILKSLTLSTALVAALASAAIADTDRTITVTGEGIVQALPDQATISLGVTTTDETAVAALAANLELSRPQSAQNDRLDATLISLAQDSLAQGETMQNLGQSVQLLAARIDAIPPQSEALLRDVADIRAGLTELRVQARMIEMQLFAISRGTDNPLARPMGIEPLGAMLADTYAS